MFGISGFELLIILVFGFILVGDRLPDVAKTLGRAIRTFQNAQRDMSKVIKEDVFDPDAEEPFKDPLAALDKMGGIAKKTGSSLAGDFSEMATVAKKKKDGSSSTSSNASSGTSEASEKESANNTAAQSTASSNNAPAETFAERRARYEKERATRLAAQAQQKAAEEAAAAEAALAAANAAVEQAEASASESNDEAPETPEASEAPANVTLANATPANVKGEE